MLHQCDYGTDLIERPTGEGKLYLCAIKDVWSNRMVGYSFADRMESAIVVNALDTAVARRAAAGLASPAACCIPTAAGNSGPASCNRHCVKTHVARVLSKLGLRTRVHLVIYAYEHGLLSGTPTGRPDRA